MDNFDDFINIDEFIFGDEGEAVDNDSWNTGVDQDIFATGEAQDIWNTRE